MSKPYIMEPVEKFGFRWGPAVVSRCMHDPKAGYIIAIQTQHKEIHVRVSPSGRKIVAGKTR